MAATKLFICSGKKCRHRNKEARHGYLVSGVRKGAVSGAFYSQEAGSMALLTGVISNFVTSHEAPGLDAGIKAIGLPEATTEADKDELLEGIGAKIITLQIDSPLVAAINNLVGSFLQKHGRHQHGFERMVKSGRYALVRWGCDGCGTSRVALRVGRKLAVASTEGAKIDTVEQAAAFLTEHRPTFAEKKADRADFEVLIAKVHELFPQADATEGHKET